MVKVLTVLSAFCFFNLAFGQEQTEKKDSRLTEAQVKIAIQEELRTLIKPDWRTKDGFFTVSSGPNKGKKIQLYKLDEEVDAFLKSKEYRAISIALFKGDSLNFKENWKSVSESMRFFYISEIDARNGFTPFHWLALEPSAEQGAVEILGEICPYRVKEDYKIYGYHYKGIDTADFSGGVTPLDAALMQNSLVLAEELIKCGADVNQVNPYTLKSPIVEAVSDLNIKALELLLREGADTSLKDRSGRGIFYYYNKAKSYLFETQKEEDMEKLKVIKDRLESLGHNFEEEAFASCMGFTEDFVISAENASIVYLEKGDKLAKARQQSEISQKIWEQQNQEAEVLKSKLVEKCEFLGFQYCEILSPNQLETRVTPVVKEIDMPTLGSKKAYVVYDNIYTRVRLMASSSGKESCK